MSASPGLCTRCGKPIDSGYSRAWYPSPMHMACNEEWERSLSWLQRIWHDRVGRPLAWRRRR